MASSGRESPPDNGDHLMAPISLPESLRRNPIGTVALSIMTRLEEDRSQGGVKIPTGGMQL